MSETPRAIGRIAVIARTANKHPCQEMFRRCQRENTAPKTISAASFSNSVTVSPIPWNSSTVAEPK